MHTTTRKATFCFVLLVASFALEVSAQTFAQNFAASFQMVASGFSETKQTSLGVPIRLEFSSPFDLDKVETIYGRVELDTFTIRHVELSTLTGNSIIARYPIPILIPGSDPTPPASYVEAWTGKLSGTIPIGFREPGKGVTFETRVRVSDNSGNMLTAGVDYQNVASDPPFVLNVLLAPRFTTWNNATTDLTQALSKVSSTLRTIIGEVNVHSPEGSTGWKEVARIEGLIVPDLPVPDVCLAFEHPSYAGAILMLVPRSSPFTSKTSVIQVLGELTGTINSLTVFAQFATFGNTLDAILPLEAGDITFKKDGEDHDLHNDEMKVQEGLFDISIDWGDEISSIAIISHNQEVDFFKKSFDGDDPDGHRLTIDPPGRNVSARIASTHYKTPDSSPSGAVSLSDDTPDMNWKDKISSYKWDEE